MSRVSLRPELEPKHVGRRLRPDDDECGRTQRHKRRVIAGFSEALTVHAGPAGASAILEEVVPLGARDHEVRSRDLERFGSRFKQKEIVHRRQPLDSPLDRVLQALHGSRPQFASDFERQCSDAHFAPAAQRGARLFGDGDENRDLASGCRSQQLPYRRTAAPRLLHEKMCSPVHVYELRASGTGGRQS